MRVVTAGTAITDPPNVSAVDGSSWLRSDLNDRGAKAFGKPVHHIAAQSHDAQTTA
ncbi:unannotated protein [freshwater metagenome]|uniref:Unannotated protein n=1 Tax=freshwater metagenome TaxID=449393 RepID=A0A6J7EAZ2_9ZZZZ|nr:hypothetical protein [Actinomycetota bacterium]